jgi:hypothetical protein
MDSMLFRISSWASMMSGMTMPQQPPPSMMSGMPGMGNMQQKSPKQLEMMLQMLENPAVQTMMQEQQLQPPNPRALADMMAPHNPAMIQMFRNNPAAAQSMVQRMLNPAALQSGQESLLDAFDNDASKVGGSECVFEMLCKLSDEYKYVMLLSMLKKEQVSIYCMH